MVERRRPSGQELGSTFKHDPRKQDRAIQSELFPALEHATRILQGIDSRPFADPGFQELKVRIAEYIGTLTAESVKLARYLGAEVVDKQHVERANSYLITAKPRCIFRHLGTFGGILLGVGLSTLAVLLGHKQASTAQALLGACLSIVGTFLIALNIAKE